MSYLLILINMFIPNVNIEMSYICETMNVSNVSQYVDTKERIICIF